MTITKLFQRFVQIELKSKLENQDFPYEPKKESIDKGKKLMYIIDNQIKPVNTLLEGITVSLEEQLEKTSEIDQQTHASKRHNEFVNFGMMHLYTLKCQGVRQGRRGGQNIEKICIPQNNRYFCAPELQGLLQAGKEDEKEKALVGIIQNGFRGIWNDTRETYKQFKAKNQQEETR
ncbi:unnamed protein product [Paramecium octaurelia]|uniref:Uncharacterized protein n=1 Tax=Paramecium octaurelia TaxID=43137 RepID=A0A8S1XR82_PAROT|nr:unnamed protein product [Paramecium octaurelia]